MIVRLLGRLLLAAIVALVVAGAASAHVLRPVRAGEPLPELEHRLVANVSHSRGAVRFLELIAGPLTPGARAELRFHRAALVWQRATLERVQRARYLQHVRRLTWPEAVELVDEHLGHGAWLLSCSLPRSEGGHGRWIWNGGGTLADWPTRPPWSSGAGGWLQFVESTFDSVIDGAVIRARRHRLEVPAFAAVWTHPLGQAIAGVEMLERGRVGEWSGYGC